MIKKKVIEELTEKSESMLNLIIEAESHDDDFSVIRELFEQFVDELGALDED